MTPRASVGDEDLPVAELLLIDDACDRFEAAWREGSEPQLAPFLAGSSALARPRLFRELLTIDLEFRLGRDERPQPAAYRVGLPDDSEVIYEVFAAFGYGGATIRSFTGTGWPGTAVRRSAEAATPLGTNLPRAVLSPAVSGAMRSAGYEVFGELGRGGMGVVYLARKLALNRLCAVKMILAGPHAGTATAARFRAEAELIARLQHPDVVKIYHVGEAEGLPFLELEYLPGGSLDKRLSGTPMPPADAARLVETIARAIAQAHREGIIPRSEAGQHSARRGRKSQGG
jgi:eukaryotic-like serine/threonine-protein kinase